MTRRQQVSGNTAWCNSGQLSAVQAVSCMVRNVPRLAIGQWLEACPMQTPLLCG